MNKIALAFVVALIPQVLANAQTAQVVSTFATTGLIRVVHASSSTQAIDVFIDDKLALGNAPYKTATQYDGFPSGAHTILVTPHNARATTLTRQTVAVVAGRYYTFTLLEALGKLTSKVFVARSLNSKPAQARVNLFQFLLGSSGIDVIRPGSSNALLATGLIYSKAKSAYLEPSALNLAITTTGKAANVLKKLNGMNLVPGKSYSVFMLGLNGGQGVQAFDALTVEDTLEPGALHPRG